MPRLTGFLPAWDLERRRVDVSALEAWVLERLRSRGHQVASLARAHEVLDPAKALEASRALCFEGDGHEARALVNALVRAALPELPFDAVAVQAIPHFRVLVPKDQVSPVPVHTDHHIGHGLDERNLWFALTDARRTAALHAVPFAESKRLLDDGALDPGFTRHRLPPLEVKKGEVLLFTPLHLHGAQVVEEPMTRVSLDVRIAPLASVRARSRATFVALEAR